MISIFDKMDDKKRVRIRKIFVNMTILFIIVSLIFFYLSSTAIDEGTDQMYQTIDTLYLISLVVLLILIIPTIVIVWSDITITRKRRKLKRKSKFGKKLYPFDIFNYGFMTLFMFLCVFPIIYVLAGSFNQGADYSAGGVYFLPRIFTFENYRVVLNNPQLWQGYLVTFLRTSIGTLTALIFTTMISYAMSRPNLKFKGAFYWFNILTMFFSGGLVPYFLIIRSLGLYNTFAVYIIPGLYSVYNMIIISTFFRSISSELHEAALVDGANEFRIYWQIFMPLSKPVLATVGLWLAVGHWNAYFDTMIYTNSPNLQTLQYFLLKAIQSSTLTEGLPPEMIMRLSPRTLSLAAIIISIIPVLAFFPFVRKNFQSGIMVGSLKG